MKRFNSLEEMVEAYKEHYNSNCKEWEFFSNQDVKDICVKFFSPVAAQYQYGIKTAKTVYIANYGYVEA